LERFLYKYWHEKNFLDLNFAGIGKKKVFTRVLQVFVWKNPPPGPARQHVLKKIGGAPN
jgi:hypothetical protein